MKTSEWQNFFKNAESIEIAKYYFRDIRKYEPLETFSLRDLADFADWLRNECGKLECK